MDDYEKLLEFSCAAALLSCAFAGSALAWHDHYHGGGVVIYDGYGYPGYGPGYYAAPPVIVAPPPAYAYPQEAYAPPPPIQYAPVQDAPVYQAQNGQYCREYTSNINVGGQN